MIYKTTFFLACLILHSCQANIPGRHDRNSPLVGSRQQELALALEAQEQHALLQSLEDALYKPENIYLIPNDRKDEADHYSKALFCQYLVKYQAFGYSEHNTVRWISTSEPGLVSNKTFVNDIENEWNSWFVEAYIEERRQGNNEKFGKYLPPHLVAYHELMHIEETTPGQSCHGRHSELLTSLKTLLLVDQVYKEIHSLDLSEEVDYQHAITVGERSWNLGALANFYRALESRYVTLAAALVSEESLEALGNYTTSGLK